MSSFTIFNHTWVEGYTLFSFFFIFIKLCPYIAHSLPFFLNNTYNKPIPSLHHFKIWTMFVFVTQLFCFYGFLLFMWQYVLHATFNFLHVHMFFMKPFFLAQYSTPHTIHLKVNSLLTFIIFFPTHVHSI